MEKKIIIVGGGIIGCTAAAMLAQAGFQVTVMEKGTLGGGATKAAAGMIAPYAESAGPGAFLELLIEAQSRLEDWLIKLQQATQLSVEYVRSGVLRVSTDYNSLSDRFSWMKEAGANPVWLDRKQLVDTYPDIDAIQVAGVFSPKEGHLIPMRLLRAVIRYGQQLGVRFLEGMPVFSLVLNEGRVVGVQTSTGQHLASEVVLTAGAWSAHLLEPIGVACPVEPVRGQIARVIPEQFDVDSRILFGDRIYIAPKPEGFCVLGATEDRAGFDERVTVSGLAHLMQGGPELIPKVGRFQFDSALAGLRPRSADGMPLVGPTKLRGLWLSSGHYRNGILLSAWSAEILRDWLLGQKPFNADEIIPLRFENSFSAPF